MRFPKAEILPFHLGKLQVDAYFTNKFPKSDNNNASSLAKREMTCICKRDNAMYQYS